MRASLEVLAKRVRPRVLLGPEALIRVWRLAGMPSGKYLAATMDLWLPKLEAYGELKSVR